MVAMPKGAVATHLQDVLGDTTISTSPQIPPTVGGPGLLLPDSPLFFLDQAKQKVRVVLAFTPEARAKIYADVASERLAELRFMLAKNDKKGIRIALEGVYDNFQNASEELDQAHLSGRSITDLSKQINDLIHEHQKALDSLESRATGLLKSQVAVAQKSLLISKVSIEEHLKAEDLTEEIRYDLGRMGKTVVLGETKAKTPEKTVQKPIAVPATPPVITSP